ncbi:Protein of unknown function [Streptococcus henryi]|uniref:DUF3169 domain-containing protein n=1 Tax=Streptococcus henryi TaxID=439219 RepID=A0A1G6CN41_9STRE|nr:DUF3169 family protein [Streptococcus henryi]SDB34155.1 Protein of unknown function [Streptococcus henryi]
MKAKKQSGTFVRLAKQFLIGGSIGAVIGGGIGFGMRHFNIIENGLPFEQETVISALIIPLRVAYLLSLLLSVYFIVTVLKDYKSYLAMDEEESEELYRQMNRNHSYATILNSVTVVISLVALLLSFKVSLSPDQAKMTFPVFDFIIMMAAGIYQSYILKVYSRIRDIKMPLAPTLKELKSNIMQLDEAELEANYKMTFDVVMNLSGVILPAIYITLFFWSLITQKVEMTGILVAAVIHLYILIKNFKMTKDYYK